MTAPTYTLAGDRPGWNFTGLTRRDDPDDGRAYRYSYFYRADGTCQAVVRMDLLAECEAKP